MHPANEVLHMHDSQGNLIAVQISAAMWKRIEPLIQKARADTEEKPAPNHNLADFAEFMDAWNFPYSYVPAVQCPGCGSDCQDWRNDAKHNFILTGASLGGLLVFRCGHCGGTVRQKYFKDHVAMEFTPPAR